MGSSASLPIVLVVVVVLVVGWGSKWLRKDGRMDEGRKASGGIKEKNASDGSFACTTTAEEKDDDDWETS